MQTLLVREDAGERPTRRRMSAHERSRAIVAATIGLFARRGFAATTTRQIARAAGVSEALVFRHFPDKRSLYRAILEEKIRDSERAVPLDELRRIGGDREFLERIASEILRLVEADDTFLRLLLRSALEGHDLAREFRRARIDKLLALLEERFARPRPARSRTPTAADPALTARAFHGMLLGVLLNRHIFQDPVSRRTPTERWARVLADAFLPYLAARGRSKA